MQQRENGKSDSLIFEIYRKLQFLRKDSRKKDVNLKTKIVNRKSDVIWKIPLPKFTACSQSAYKATPVFSLVGNKIALSKSVNEFLSIISSRIATYFSPIAA